VIPTSHGPPEPGLVRLASLSRSSANPHNLCGVLREESSDPPERDPVTQWKSRSGQLVNLWVHVWPDGNGATYGLRLGIAGTKPWRVSTLWGDENRMEGPFGTAFLSVVRRPEWRVDLGCWKYRWDVYLSQLPKRSLLQVEGQAA